MDRRLRVLAATIGMGMIFSSGAVSAATFSDVPDSSIDAAAVEFVASRGIMRGSGDGKFRPNDLLTRASVIKLLVSTKLTDQEVQLFTGNSYTDVPDDAWYRPYAEAGRQMGILNTSLTSLNGERPVQLVEFLKMLFTSQSVDTNAYGEIKLPLSTDVTDTGAWFYPHLRYALASSLIQVDETGNLFPAHTLTRIETARMLYYFASYQAGKRTQALLSEEESELLNIIELLQGKQLEQAEFASARALLASRGALTSKPTAPIVQGAVKVAEAFRALVRGYRAGSSGDFATSLQLAKESWSLADRAKQLSPNLSALGDQVQSVAKSMADEARRMQGEGA